MAQSEHYPGCWRKHLTCARYTVEFEMARRQRAENALLEILRESAWESRLTEWRKHNVTAVGTQPTPQEACRKIRAIARAALRIGCHRQGDCTVTETARLVDELTTLLYEVTTGWDDSAGGHQVVRCGACRRRADRAESVVHESDCPVYRLIRAEEANTAVIRANAEEIADLEDVRDELEAQVNALTAQMECRNELTARIRALEVENERGRQAFADLTLASVERINALEAYCSPATSLLLTHSDRCPHGHPNCCGHHDLEDMPIHEQGAHE